MPVYVVMCSIATVIVGSVIGLTIGAEIEPLRTARIVSLVTAGVGFYAMIMGWRRYGWQAFYRKVFFYGCVMILIGASPFVGSFIPVPGLAFTLFAIVVPVLGGVYLLELMESTYVATPWDDAKYHPGLMTTMLMTCLLALVQFIWWLPGGNIRLCSALTVLMFLFAGLAAFFASLKRAAEETSGTIRL